MMGRILISVILRPQQLILEDSPKAMKPVRSQKFIKWQTYIITFISYVALHTMRMSYSQVKSKFQTAYGQSNLFLGLFDALVYIALGTGFFFRFLLQGKKNLKLSLVIFLTIACIGYIFIPVSSLIFGSSVKDNFFLQQFLPGIGLLLFGFFQFPAWPTLLTLTSQYFNLEQEGKAMGIWSANGDLGNIVGFAMCGLLVDTLGWRWQVAMLIAAGLNWVMAIMVYLFVKQKKELVNPQLTQNLISEERTNNPNNPNATQRSENPNLIQDDNTQSKFRDFLEFSKVVISTTENKLYLFVFGLLKSILYGFLLWMPTYLTHINLSQYKSSIPIVFNAGTLVGSFLLGYVYEDMDTSGKGALVNIKKNIKRYSLFYSCIGLTAMLAVFYIIDANVPAYFALSVICGAFLGGCFNMLASNQVISLTGGRKEDVNKLSTLTMVAGNWMVGIVEIIIGVVLDLKNDPQGDKKLFPILVAVGIISILTLFWRSCLIAKRQSLDNRIEAAKIV